ncbi:MAG: transposase zinc-binding domain-containing protein [Sphingobacteriales bacterium]|nr:transposase zinc-binding domain-containing protein [Sphingobacteriales bacterium]
MQSKIFAHPEVKTFNSYSQAVLSKLSRCHTSGIGVHQYRCSNEGCSHVHYQYHSCGNRHCPNCGGTKREQCLPDWSFRRGSKTAWGNYCPLLIFISYLLYHRS